MEAQEIFNTVATHLFKQGHPATMESGACVYRAPKRRAGGGWPFPACLPLGKMLNASFASIQGVLGHGCQ